MTRCNPDVPATLLAHDKTKHCCVLLLSRLAPHTGAVAVADLFKRCRERHNEMAITGACSSTANVWAPWCAVHRSK